MASTTLTPYFYLGCAVWAYPGWVGRFYPLGSRSKDFLQLYSQRFTAVEGNTTFYSRPAPQMVARWATETPNGFKFCPKLPKAITHQGLLQPAIAATLDFIELMRGLHPDETAPSDQLANRLGVIFAQLPPSYGPDRLGDLAAFLEAWPNSFAALALEVRHPAWFQEPYTQQLNALLQLHRIGRVLLDTRPIYSFEDDPQVHSERRKPQLPLQITTTSDFTFVRFISHPRQENNASFLAEWVKQVQIWLNQGTTVYFFVHCPEEVRSPDLAWYFQCLLEDAGVPVPALPWNLLRSQAVQMKSCTDQQLSLF